MRTFMLTLVVAITPFLSASGQQAAIRTATIAGAVFVSDPAGNHIFVPGAKVELRGPVSLATESDEKGNYIFASLPAGTYTVQGFSAGLHAANTISVHGGEAVLVPCIGIRLTSHRRTPTTIRASSTWVRCISSSYSSTMNHVKRHPHYASRAGRFYVPYSTPRIALGLMCSTESSGQFQRSTVIACNAANLQ